MMQTIGTLLIILAVFVPVAFCGVGAFFKAMEAHAEYYRYGQSHHIEQSIDVENEER